MLFKQMSGSWKTGLKIEKGNTRLKFTVINIIFTPSLGQPSQGSPPSGITRGSPPSGTRRMSW